MLIFNWNVMFHIDDLLDSELNIYHYGAMDGCH